MTFFNKQARLTMPRKRLLHFTATSSQQECFRSCNKTAHTPFSTCKPPWRRLNEASRIFHGERVETVGNMEQAHRRRLPQRTLRKSSCTTETQPRHRAVTSQQNANQIRERVTVCPRIPQLATAFLSADWRQIQPVS